MHCSSTVLSRERALSSIISKLYRHVSPMRVIEGTSRGLNNHVTRRVIKLSNARWHKVHQMSWQQLLLQPEHKETFFSVIEVFLAF